MVTLALALLLAQTPQHRLFLQPNLPQGPDFAFFEAFPANGAGTFGACSTTAPTGAKGEALTFARASTATCTKTATGGLATTGIANGDLVVMSSNQPRVEYDSAGKLKLLVESSRTNNLLRSEEIDNAAWATETRGGAGVLSITANAATAPDGALTADRITFGATSVAADSSLRFQGGGCGNPCAVSIYVRGVSGSGTLDLASALGATAPCSYVSTSWTRCTAVLASAGFWGIGNLAFYNGGTTRPAQDVYVWGAQGETASYATSYIPTVASALVRSVEPGASLTLASSVGPNGCIAASFQWPSASVGAVNIASLGVAGAGNNLTLYRTSNTAAGYQVGAIVSAPAVPAINLTVHRSVLTDLSGVRSAYWDAASVTAPAASMSGGQTAFQIGAVNGGGTPIDGLVGEIQVDPNPSRCSP